jgi:uncharacterized protein with LGFP repeats
VRTNWAGAKYEAGALGYPTTEEVFISGGVYQQFQGGRIYWSNATGAQNIHGGIGEKYISTGAHGSFLGYPLMNERCGLVNGGCYQLFQGGSIYWSSSSSAHLIKGGIGEYWGELGYERGRLGYPLADEVCGTGSCMQLFQGGRIYWTSTLGSIQTWGGIGKRYADLGAETSTLGNPTSFESCGLKNGGCTQTFTNGSILWSASSGAWESYGPIREYWMLNGGVNGFLAYPTGRVSCGLKNGGCAQVYQNGRIYWSASTNAQSMHGAILNKYLSLGAENSALGYPISSETTLNGITSQKFEHGTLYWTAKRGVWQ